MKQIPISRYKIQTGVTIRGQSAGYAYSETLFSFTYYFPNEPHSDAICRTEDVLFRNPVQIHDLHFKQWDEEHSTLHPFSHFVANYKLSVVKTQIEEWPEDEMRNEISQSLSPLWHSTMLTPQKLLVFKPFHKVIEKATSRSNWPIE